MENQTPESRQPSNDPKMMEAVNYLINGLCTDPDFYYAYQANIAGAICDQFHSLNTKNGKFSFKLNQFANDAAIRFLTHFTQSYADEKQSLDQESGATTQN